MRSNVLEIREKTVGKSAENFGTKNALARIVRRRWRSRTVQFVIDEWGLTEGEARGVVYAQASQTTIDKIKQHPNGGWRLSLEIDALVIGLPFEQFIQEQAGEARRERIESEARERRLAALADGVSGDGVLDRRRA